MLPSRETAMTGKHDAPGLVEFGRATEAAGFDSGVGRRLATGPCPRGGPVDPVGCRRNRVTLGTAALIAPAAAGRAGGDGRPTVRGPPHPRARRGRTAAGEPPRIRRCGHTVRRPWRPAGRNGEPVVTGVDGPGAVQRNVVACRRYGRHTFCGPPGRSAGVAGGRRHAESRGAGGRVLRRLVAVSPGRRRLWPRLGPDPRKRHPRDRSRASTPRSISTTTAAGRGTRGVRARISASRWA
ncbi:MAG: hypothetical protein QOE41_713 [Mycobacterium sp.]|nr:flavin-dependent oxidoreductase, F420-dependent methylene-tetrahydromethanopterin reductase [Mycobacterium sp.]MDT5131402.1 hypothetical protein [Mycobacterium sp.]